MKKWQKASLALATVGGAVLMAAPAFASVNVNASAAVGSQSQDGSYAYGTVMDQNQSLQVGQLQADQYYNSTNDNGFTTTQKTFIDDGYGNELAQSQTTQNYGGSSWTSASDYTNQGASVTQNQSQIITNGSYADWFWDANGGLQQQSAAAVSGSLHHDGITGGAAVSEQTQSGDLAYDATLSQSANVQAGLMQARNYQFNVNNNGSTSTTRTFTAGTLVSSTSTTDFGGSSYTQAHDLSNPTAGVAQRQDQNIGLPGYGGTQDQSGAAVAGSLNAFWGGHGH
ncbi:hypothetical protein [Alicyclobacillus sp.]|uniref:hypothetical protein n=1 Tax=Alicyclobacillus sp. TaxID=61169 RepID=UPI0025B95885|nr:hypothetical protein [Alicyclobacillus sp.]MCL6518107.1 hypothetical protein [Alicyclobacillus sp.]